MMFCEENHKNDILSLHDTDFKQSTYGLDYGHERDDIAVNAMDFDNSYNKSVDDVSFSMSV